MQTDQNLQKSNDKRILLTSNHRSLYNLSMKHMMNEKKTSYYLCTFSADDVRAYLTTTSFGKTN
jgi:hypothetical protein